MAQVTGLENPQVVNPAVSHTIDGKETGNGYTVKDEGKFTDPNSTNEGHTHSLVEELLPGLHKEDFDRKVVKCGFARAPINAMTRDMGWKRTKSMRYGYWTVDLKDIEDEVTAAITAGGTGYDRAKPAITQITVANSSIFDVTDQISFYNPDKTKGVYGYKNATDTKVMPCLPLNARVCEIVDEHTMKVQFLNASTTALTIPTGTAIFSLGHAAAETDASTVPHSALPDKSEQFMQKFMVQSLISSIEQEQTKDVDWEKQDIDEMLLQQFSEDIEKTYIWGIKNYTYDTKTRQYTYTCAGIIQQMLEGGSHYITIYKNDLKNDETVLINAVSEIFVGNSGSATRYMYTGTEFSTALFSTKLVSKQINVNSYDEAFGYNFTRINVLGYELRRIAHPMLDKMRHGRFALVIDRPYLEKRVFRSMTDTILKLREVGVYDGDSTVWCEISSPILKYPKCHAIIELIEGSAPTI